MGIGGKFQVLTAIECRVYAMAMVSAIEYWL